MSKHFSNGYCFECFLVTLVAKACASQEIGLGAPCERAGSGDGTRHIFGLLEPHLLLGRMAASHHSTSGMSSSLPSLLGPRSASLVAEEMPVLRAAEAMLV